MVESSCGLQTAVTRKPEDRDSASEGGKVTKTIFTKTMVVGRATVFLVGLAVILALVFGAASMALGASGQPFILGKNNAADALSRLTGNVNGSAMQVVNNNPDANDTALNLSVQSGEAPMRVNSDTKVTNLNADHVDGMDANSFLKTNGKAADAETLDGKDSAQFMTASTYYSTSPEMTGQNIGNGTGIHHAEFGCDAGDQLITGGYRWMINATSVAVVGSWPIPNSNRWAVQWANNGSPNQPYPMQIYVKCADTAAPAHN